jgi:hypothetical protein
MGSVDEKQQRDRQEHRLSESKGWSLKNKTSQKLLKISQEVFVSASLDYVITQLST